MPKNSLDVRFNVVNNRFEIAIDLSTFNIEDLGLWIMWFVDVRKSGAIVLMVKRNGQLVGGHCDGMLR